MNSFEMPITKEIAAIRLLQLQTISTELLDWISELTADEFTALWEGRACVANKHFVKIETLLDVMRTLVPVLETQMEQVVVA